MRDRAATRAIRELAERQHGVVAHRQLLDLGVGGTAVRRRVAAGLLVPVFQGVFAVGHRRLSREGHWMSAVLASGRRTVLSHGTAMELWDMRRSRGPVEVLRASGGPTPTRPGVRIHQTRALPAGEVAVERGIPVTTVERTLRDMAGRLDGRQIEHAIVAADRSRRISWPELHRLLGRGRGRKGIRRLRIAAERLDPSAVDARSDLEVDFLALGREAGLPLPQVNVLVGGFLVDFLWPQQKVVVETDSYTYHSDPGSFENDHRRTVALEAAGYEVHRATRRMLESEPDQILNLVRRSLRTAT
jgi:hypothetical protein